MLYETEIAISAALASICFEHKYVIGDGSCYFRCFSKYIFLEKKYDIGDGNCYFRCFSNYIFLEKKYDIDGNCYFRCFSKFLCGTEVCYRRR